MRVQRKEEHWFLAVTSQLCSWGLEMIYNSYFTVLKPKSLKSVSLGKVKAPGGLGILVALRGTKGASSLVSTSGCRAPSSVQNSPFVSL